MDDIQIFIINPMIYSGLAYWGMSGFWFIFDIIIAPYGRISGGEIINWKLYRKTANHVLKLHSLTPIVLYMMIPLWKYRGIDTSSNSLLSILTLFKLLMCPIISDLIFYCTHKMIHYNNIYKYVHKTHHEWIVPCGIAASYASYTEYFLCNLPTFLLPPLILNLNWIVCNLWFIISTINVVNNHSGYIFLDSSVHHSNHHKYKRYNYGTYLTDNVFKNEILPNNK